MARHGFQTKSAYSGWRFRNACTNGQTGSTLVFRLRMSSSIRRTSSIHPSPAKRGIDLGVENSDEAGLGMIVRITREHRVDIDLVPPTLRSVTNLDLVRSLRCGGRHAAQLSVCRQSSRHTPMSAACAPSRHRERSRSAERGGAGPCPSRPTGGAEKASNCGLPACDPASALRATSETHARVV